jgi:PAS domain S-box-containing protein
VKQTNAFISSVVICCVLLLIRPLFAADDDSTKLLPTALVTSGILESKIAEAEAATNLIDEKKTKLVELYRNALSNLQALSSHEKLAESFRLSINTAPQEIQVFYPPTYFVKDGKAHGVAIDLLSAISKRTGVRFQFLIDVSPFNQDLEGLVNHTGPDLLPSLQDSPEREKVILFTKPYSRNPRFIFTRDDAPFVAAIEDLFDHTVAVEEGFLVQQWLIEKFPNIELLSFANSKEALQAVSTGRASAYIGPIRPTAIMINKYGFHNLKAAAPSSLPDGITRMGVRYDWPELRSIIDIALGSIPPEEKAAITHKWAPIKTEHGIRPADVLKWLLVVAGVGVGVAVVLLFVVWNRSLSRHVRERTEQLNESEERYRALFEQDQLGIIFADAETRRFKYANLAAARMLGYTQQELCALGVEDVHPIAGINLPRHEAKELPYLRKDGSILYADVSGGDVTTSEGAFTIGFISDVTDRKQAQQAHKISEQRFRAIMEQAPFSIVVNSPDGRIIQVNQAFMDLWGISEQALPKVLEEYNILQDDEARKRGVMPLIEKAFRGEAVSLPEIEYDVTSTMREMDIEGDESGKRWVKVRLYPIRGDRGELLNVVVVEGDITERRQAEEMLQVYQERLRALAVTLTRTEEQERRKIAAELHDHVGQSLAVMRIQLAAAKNEAGGRKVGVMLDDVSESLREAIKDTRSIMSDLSSPTLNELGLSAAIADWLKEKIEDRHGLQTCFEDDGEPKLLSDDTSAMAFHSVRELLMNVIKHANASRVTVNIRKEGHILKIIVEDDGVGMPASIEREHKSDVHGFGLFSIRERMNDIDGSLSIESPPGQGVRAILSIPLEDAS